MLKFLQFLAIIALVVCEKVRYDNYSIYKIQPKIEQHLRAVQTLRDNFEDLDFWSDPVYLKEINVLVPPELKNKLEDVMVANHINNEVVVPNIQSLIDIEKVMTYNSRNGRSMQWDTYYTLDGINNWLNELATNNPNVVTVVNGGRSYEGRNIVGIKISHGTGKRNIFIESGIHAREWISPATTNYITNELLYSDDPKIQAIAREFDWHIFPVTNPDGYVFTHEQDRLWRKNRRPFGNAFGVDLNRNWNSNWLGLGSSSNPASNTYAGPGPFSEVESRTLSEYIISIASEMELYISFHSSGQLLLIPYGNTTDPLDNYDDAMHIGLYAMDVLSQRFGTVYTTGNVAETIYYATGLSLDWVKERLRVPLVYCYELRDRGQFGHLLPANQIQPTSIEVMDSIVALISEAKVLGYMNSAANSGLSVFIAIVSIMTLLMG